MFTVNHKHCTGCGSCVEACPQLALIPIRDKYRFIYPSVEAQRCIECGKCQEVCPLDKPVARPDASIDTVYYAARARDKHRRADAHAGGIFGLFAEAVLAEGGAVYGCAFDENRHPRHIRVDSTDGLRPLLGRKPVQSDLSGIFPAVRRDAESGITVLFSGTPCQCDGLRRFLGRDYPNLILVDMLCGGVTSEGVFHRYVNWLERRLGGRLPDIRFENKPAFGRREGVRMLCLRGKWQLLFSFPAQLDRLLSMSREGYINRRSCGVCRYATPERTGDITLGRFENIRRAHPDFPYDGGVSLVMISSAKGAGLFSQIAGDLDYEISDFDRARANRRLTTPPPERKHRAQLLTDIFRHGFGKAAENYGSVGLLRAVGIMLCSAFPERAVMLWDKFFRKCRNAAGKLLRRPKNADSQTYRQ